jgi:DNA-binding CsgD family transcriptional regulator
VPTASPSVSGVCAAGDACATLGPWGASPTADLRPSPGEEAVAAWRPALLGREQECAAIDALLERVRGGSSGALLIRGEAGLGKSTLLDYAAASADGFRTLRAAGVEGEIELPYAGLQHLCAPLLNGIEALPPPQRDAIEVAFGLSAGDAPDAFLVGLAALSMLSAAAEEKPLLVLVDDAQWLGQASRRALAFVGRRLGADTVALLLAARGAAEELEAVPELVLGGLADADARRLLDTVLVGHFDEPVRERFLAETRGNPLALLELPATLTPAEAASGLALHSGVALSGRIEESFRRRVAALPEDTRRLLLLNAADPVGDPMLLYRAAEALGIGLDAADAAEEEGLVDLRERITFRHPLVRSAVYRSASGSERRRAHQAIADAIDPDLEPDRRAWHRAQATAAPSEEIAAELELTAERAKARGGLAASAAFLEQAAALTPDPARRAGRRLTAAQVKYEAGALDDALALLTATDAEPLDELQQARSERLHAQIEIARGGGTDALLLLLAAARRLGPLDTALAQETALEAVTAAYGVGSADAIPAVAEALDEAPLTGSARPAELLLRGWARLLNDGYPAGTDLLRDAMLAFRDEPLSSEREFQAVFFAVGIAVSLWDFDSLYAIADRFVRLGREAGALGSVPIALENLADAELAAGDFAAASAKLAEADALNEAMGSTRAIDVWPRLYAWRDDETSAEEQIDRFEQQVGASDAQMTNVELARALLYNAVGRYDDAAQAAQRACDHHPLKAFGRALAELVEGAERSGDRARAEAAFEQLAERTRLGDNDWSLGLEARLRGLLGEGEDAERLYREAIERLSRTRVRTELARAHLVYGEWLRRENRRVDAREQLRIAHRLFTSMGAAAFTERARRELVATGEVVRKRTDEARGDLTAQEEQIARLAASGWTNTEIGAQLFLSPRTVEWHLRKVFTKLGVHSRRELRGMAEGATA